MAVFIRELSDISCTQIEGKWYIELWFGQRYYAHTVEPGEEASNIIRGMNDSNESYMDVIRIIIHDLSNRCTSTISELPETEWKKFVYHWRKQIFKNLVERFQLKERLSLDDAIQVVREHMIVSPVMDS